MQFTVEGAISYPLTPVLKGLPSVQNQGFRGVFWMLEPDTQQSVNCDGMISSS